MRLSIWRSRRQPNGRTGSDVFIADGDEQGRPHTSSPCRPQGTWVEVSAPPFSAGIGPCDPGKFEPYLSESHVGFQAGSTTLLEATATFASADFADRALQNERSSLASCKPGTGYAPWAISLGDDSVGYTQIIGDQTAAIAFVRVATDVIGIDYIQSQPPIDLGKAADLTRAAVDKATAAR